MFNNLLFSNIDLLKYNDFFKLNLNLLKYQHFFFLFNVFLKKFNINVFVILDYKRYHLYFQYFNNIGVSIFSFVNRINFINYLDFYYLSNFNFVHLEKIFFLSKIMQCYNYTYYNKTNKFLNFN